MNEYFTVPVDGRQLVFDISKLRELAETLPGAHVRVADIAGWLQLNHNVDPAHAMTRDLKQPIILARIEDTFMVVDGSHRLYRAVREGCPELPCRIIQQDQLFSCAVTGDVEVYRG